MLFRSLGATQWQTVRHHVLPAAIPGILTGTILGLSRAIGETTIVLIAAGQLPQMTLAPGKTVETMTAFIAATGAGDVPVGSTAYKTIFAVGLTLFILLRFVLLGGRTLRGGWAVGGATA